MTVSVSIVVPVFRERDNIIPLLERISSVLEGGFEVLFVDDGSDDGTDAVLVEAAERYEFVRVLFMGRRLGKGMALLAGYTAAEGDTLLTLDADLQNPPAEIPKLLSALDSAHLVVGWRRERSDSSFRKIQSMVYNTVLRLFAGSPFHDINCGLRAFRREILNDSRLFTDRHRLFPFVAHSAGYVVKEVDVSHSPRHSGRSKYGLGRLFSAIADIIIATILRLFARRPSLALTVSGLLSVLTGVVIITYLLILRMKTGSIQWRYPLLSVGVVTLVVGIQLLLTGFITALIVYGSVRPPRPVRTVSKGRR